MEAALLAVALLAPATARAGLAGALRVGVARNGGSILEGGKTTNYVGTMFPLQLEAGWKFRDRLTLTGFFAMNFGLVSGSFKDSCDAGGLDCTANQTRVGGQAQWNFRPSQRLDPWVGVGAAWEVLGIESQTGTSGVNWNYQGTGYELQVGCDYWVRRWHSVSPYLAFSAGKYDESKEVSAPLSDWQSIPDQKWHFLFTIGVRAGFDLGGKPRTDGPRPAEQPASEPPPAAPQGT